MRPTTAILACSLVWITGQCLAGDTLPSRYWGKTLIIKGSGRFCTSVQPFSLPIPQGLPPQVCKQFTRITVVKLLKTRIVEQSTGGNFDGDIKRPSAKDIEQGTGSAFILNQTLDLIRDQDVDSFNSFYSKWKSSASRTFTMVSHSSSYQNDAIQLSIVVSYRDAIDDRSSFQSSFSHHLQFALDGDTCRCLSETDYASGFKRGDRTMTATRFFYDKTSCQIE